MTGDCIAIVTALLQRANREGVAQIVDAWISAAVRTPELGAVEELQEDATNGGVGKRLAGHRDEESIPPCHLSASYEIPVECLSSRRVQRQEATLLELGLANDEPVRGHVVELQPQRFRDPHSGRGDEAEQRRVHERPDRACWLQCCGGEK